MKSLRIAVLQHSEATPQGSVEDWTQRRGHQATVFELFNGASLPSLNEFDWLISLGGPMNCDETEQFPFLAAERELIGTALKADKRVLGLCLGAQLMARALGASVQPNQHWEAGWHPVQIDDPWLGKEGAAQPLMVFQWHRDTFDLPVGSRRIATNSITINQGFRLSPRAVAVQFHPEATREWVLARRQEVPYPKGPYVRSSEDLESGLSHLSAMTQWFNELLNQMEGAL